MRHVGRLLGFVLGLLIVTGEISIFAMVFSADFFRSYTPFAAIITVSLILFGCLLLVPRRHIRKNPILRILFFASALIFLWRCLAGMFHFIEAGDFAGYHRSFLLLLAIVVVFAIWNIVAVIKKEGEQVGDGDAEEAV